VYFGENINSVAGQHWQSFAMQDYFDEHGVFYNTLVSGPALITLLAVLVSEVQQRHAAWHVLVVATDGAHSNSCAGNCTSATCSASTSAAVGRGACVRPYTAQLVRASLC
jgi:hypothetical protein